MLAVAAAECRGDAGVQPRREPSDPSFPRTRESSDFRAGAIKVAGFPRSRE
ncbi:hypothetical protein [Lysobacter gummosus]|uniref:hypothetical protein n=1 Tax=Lysobacter gummosus TaxID=262324 RepID=UPI00362BDB1A